jgi:hypothetical protein
VASGPVVKTEIVESDKPYLSPGAGNSEKFHGLPLAAGSS